MTRRQTKQTALLTSFLQAYFVIPFWDLQILLAALRSSEADERQRLRARLAAYGVALVLAVLGWAALHPMLGAPCCQATSTGLAPGQSPGSLIWPRLPVSLGLLAISGVAGAIICGMLIGAGIAVRRLVKPGAARTAISLAGWLVSSLLTVPLGVVGLLAVLVLGARFGWLPVTVGHTWHGLLIPAVSVALLPALFAARRVEQALADPAAQPQQTIRLAARAFYGASGWLLGGLTLVEAIFGIDGLGKLLVDAYRVRDIPVFLSVLLLFMVTTAIFRLHMLALENGTSPAAAKPPTPSKLERILRLGIPLLVLALTLLTLLVKPALPNPAALYVGADAAHPWGTDALGRDLLVVAAAAIRNGWAIALAGTLVSLGLGGLWAVGIETLRQNKRHWLADGLRAPAEALILLAPAPLTVLLLLLVYPAGHLTGFTLGGWIGLALIPRTVWGLTVVKKATLPSLKLWQEIGTCFIAGAYSVLQTSLLAVMLNGKIPGQLITPGNLLASYQDLIAGAVLLNGGPYLRLTIILSLPGIVLVWGLYLILDAIAAGDHVVGLSDLFS